MQFYYRTGESTGIGVGPIGALVVGMFYVTAFAVLIALFALYVVGWILVALVRGGVRAARNRRRVTPA